MEYRIIGDDGKEYGPVDLDTIRAWASQGRISPLTMVSRSDSGRWAHAENYAELEGFIPKRPVAAPAPATPLAGTEPGAGAPGAQGGGVPAAAQPPEIPGLAQPVQATSFPPHPIVPGRGAFPTPGRGDTILALGLISLLGSTIFSCLCIGIILGPATGIPAWVMGAGDLRKIDAGLISPHERGNTKGGMICGIIGTFAGPLIGLGITAASLIPFLSGLSGLGGF